MGKKLVFRIFFTLHSHNGTLGATGIDAYDPQTVHEAQVGELREPVYTGLQNPHLRLAYHSAKAQCRV